MNDKISVVDWLRYASDNISYALDDLDEACKLDVPDDVFQHLFQAYVELSRYHAALDLLVAFLKRKGYGRSC